MIDEPTYRPEEFFPIFDRLPKIGQAVICGGQAVNLLATVFLPEKQIEEILGSTGSATSSDIDIIISQDLKRQIMAVNTKSSGFSLRPFADCRQPIQFTILPDDMPDTRIDVLRDIRGIHTEKDRVFEDSLNLDTSPYNVINPITLLIAKAENCVTLEQDSPTDKRNDVSHTRLMIPIVHNYLKELVSACDPKSKREQREIIRFLKRFHAASKKTNFKNGLKMAGGSLREAIPAKHIFKSKLETLKRYAAQAFGGIG